MEDDPDPLDRQPSGASPPAYLIRAARPDDADELSVLNNLPGYRWGTLRLPYETPELVRKWIENRAAGNLGLVALSEGRIVGSCGLQRLDGRRSHAAYLGMGVHDDFVGRGVGTALLRALIDTADNWLNLRRLELTVFVDNAPALALYRGHGFEVEGTHRDYAFRNGSFVDAYAMARVR